jgi:ribosomal protein S16
MTSPHLPQNLPFYRLVVAEDKAPRDGRHLEVVGHYDPAPGLYPAGDNPGLAAAPHTHTTLPCAAAADGNKHVAINFDRVK